MKFNTMKTEKYMMESLLEFVKTISERRMCDPLHELKSIQKWRDTKHEHSPDRDEPSNFLKREKTAIKNLSDKYFATIAWDILFHNAFDKENPNLEFTDRIRKVRGWKNKYSEFLNRVMKGEAHKKQP